MPTPGLDWIVNGLFHPSSKGQQPVSSPPPLEQRHERAAASSPTPLSSSPPAGLASTPPDHTIGNRRRTLSNTSTDSEEPEEAALVASAPTSYSNAVVVGVDSSQHSADAVSHALANAQPGDTVHVCYCYSPLQDYVCPEYSKAHGHVEEQNWARRQQSIFSNFMKTHNFDKAPEGVRLETHIVAGDPRDKLPELAETCRARGIVVGTPSPSLLGSLLGSVSTDLARHSTRPVTLVPPMSSANIKAFSDSLDNLVGQQ